MLDRVSNLHIVLRDDRKNQDCMVELGLKHNDVADILLGLKEANYSETIDDLDRTGKNLWVFGIMYNECELYIKISLRKIVVCVSFHFKEKDIVYPYCK